MAQIQKTIVIVKPSLVAEGRVDDIRNDLQLAGLTIIAEIANRRITLDEARNLFTRGVVPSQSDLESLIGDRAHVFLLAHPDAIGIVVRQVAMTIRPRYDTYYGVYCSEGLAAADRDVRFFFPRSVTDGFPTDAEAREYVQTHLQDVLVRGLTEIAKNKPQDPIRSLAEFLLSQNPNRPRVAM